MLHRKKLHHMYIIKLPKEAIIFKFFWFSNYFLKKVIFLLIFFAFWYFFAWNATPQKKNIFIPLHYPKEAIIFKFFFSNNYPKKLFPQSVNNGFCFLKFFLFILLLNKLENPS